MSLLDYDFTVPETVDLSDPDRELGGTETSDVIHRAGFPRSAPHWAFDDREQANAAVALMTVHASAMADARCGIAPDTPSGPAAGTVGARGTLRWYRHYLHELDRAADALAPGWRAERLQASPYPWTEVAFGSISPWGRRAAPPDRPYGASSDLPRVVGTWTFDLPEGRELA